MKQCVRIDFEYCESVAPCLLSIKSAIHPWVRSKGCYVTFNQMSVILSEDLFRYYVERFYDCRRRLSYINVVVEHCSESLFHKSHHNFFESP